MQTSGTYLFALAFLVVLLGIVGTSPGLTGMQVYDTTASGAPGTTLGGAVEFLRSFGFFTVVLPFLLIFTIVFGVLEKTKIFGTEKYKNEDVPRRSLNSVVAFCIAFFVVAASNVVRLLEVSVPIVALILVVIIVFLLLFGSLMGAEELKKGMSLWAMKGFKRVFVTAVTVAVLATLLAGFGLLDDLYYYITTNLSGTFITSLVLLIIVVLAMWFVLGRRGEPEEKKEG